jgi:hypothetical protein
MTQRVRQQLLSRADPGGAGQTHQLPQVTLAQPPAGGGGQQRPAQLSAGTAGPAPGSAAGTGTGSGLRSPGMARMVAPGTDILAG